MLVLVADVAAAMVLQGHHVSTTQQTAGLDLSIGAALLVALALAAVRLFLQLLVAWLPARITAEVQADLRVELFDAFTRASWATQADESEGRLQELMTDQVTHASQAVLYFANSLTAAAMFLALLVSAFALDPVVALVVLAATIVLFQGLRPIDRLGRRAAEDMSQATIAHASAVSESVRLAQEAQVFGAAPAYRKRVGVLVDTVRVAFYRTQLTARVIGTVYQSLVIMLIVAGLAGLYLLGTSRLASLGAVVLMLVRALRLRAAVPGGQPRAHPDDALPRPAGGVNGGLPGVGPG